jgi:hypothetical protein
MTLCSCTGRYSWLLLEHDELAIVGKVHIFVEYGIAADWEMMSVRAL